MTCPLLGGEKIPWEARLVLGIFNTITSLTSILGNGFVVFIILYHTRLRKRSNYLLILLACTDLGVGIIVQPLMSAQLFEPSIGQNCAVTYSVTYLSALFCGASAWILTLISYDRYLRLVKLQNYNIYMSKKKFYGMILFCWLYPILFPTMMFVNVLLDAYYITLVLSAWLCMGLIFYFYFRSWRFVKLKSKVFPTSLNRNGIGPHRSERKVARHWRMAKTVAIVIACFVVAWSPLSFFLIFEIFWRFMNFSLGTVQNYIHMVYYTTLLIGYSNSCINPLIYYWRTEDLKRAMKRFIFGRRKEGIETVSESYEMSNSKM